MSEVLKLSKQNGKQSMTKEGRGKIVRINKKARTRYISVPAFIACDSAFPFDDGEDVKIIISGRTVIVKPLDE